MSETKRTVEKTQLSVFGLYFIGMFLSFSLSGWAIAKFGMLTFHYALAIVLGFAFFVLMMRSSIIVTDNNKDVMEHVCHQKKIDRGDRE